MRHLTNRHPNDDKHEKNSYQALHDTELLACYLLLDRKTT
jgi:hypothetical protein